ncbi:MAG TPA: ATP-binding protein, partial [Myxococcota bacterium]
LTGLLHYAKEHRGDCPRVLVVIEEAHTVIPEANTMGLGDYDSRGLVGKIAQVALQGRKYGVGLLVIAQRTATVSKTVLTQCNTIITLNTFDETSLGFLKNMYGKTHTDLIADLLPLQAVIHGKGVRAERPVMVDIPFDSTKEELGD